MVFRYYDGRVDERYCIGTDYRGGFCYAEMVNDDYTTEEIFYDDLDYGREVRIGDPCIDCPKEVRALVREKEVLGECGWYAHRGDIVEVIKGKKYPIGMKMAVIDCKEVRFGSHMTLQIIFGSEKGIERIDADNVKIIAIRGGSKNQEQYNDVHDITYSDNIREVVA